SSLRDACFVAEFRGFCIVDVVSGWPKAAPPEQFDWNYLLLCFRPLLQSAAHLVVLAPVGSILADIGRRSSTLKNCRRRR
ncbi:MAG TPA: hypothetical protein VMU57_03975, partial [Edaphobacter sp.]|uniref:hypothetical protein n=1 Tax=Edaphobacter sp. TaxID=1934404 RepID=UPI002B95D44D